MELSIAAKLVNESNVGMANVTVYVYAYTAAGAQTRIAYGRTGATGTVNLKTSHALVQSVQPRMLLRYYDSKARATRSLTNQVQTYSASKVNFGTLTVKSSVALKVSTASFYGVSSALASFSAAAVDSEKTALSTRVSTLSADKTQLERQLSSLTTEKTSLLSQVSSLTKSKTSLQTSVNNLGKDKTDLTARITSLTKDASGLQKQLASAEAGKSQLQQQLSNEAKASAAKTSQIRSLSASLSRARSDKSTLTTQLSQAKSEKNAALATLREQHAAVLEEKQQELDRLNSQVEEHERAAGAETNLRDLVLNTASQLETAREGLKQGGKNYRLGNISMKLRVAPGPTGTGFSFLKKDEVDEAKTGALSEIAIDFPAEDDTRAATLQTMPAPRLIGYTEPLARRKLQPWGLNLDVAYQVVPDGDAGESMVGRVMRQIPDAGSGELEAGATITVFIGKAVTQTAT